ncbi:MAG TPA: glycosyltransferase family 39 protein, partial [Ktedonobacterales bacterium]|nr:glycosyltransferase family 39 protein [Ktedonobacterales bacterium]
MWNIFGVGLCYIFALRYFGRRIASIGTLLFATCGAAVNYSRFIWQPNYLPPLLVLWAITLYAGCVQGRRRWFVGHATILLLAILLHSVVALLIPVTGVAVALAPQRPRLVEYGAVALIALVLAAPTLIWEAISNGYDARALYHSALHGGQIDLQVIRSLYAVLGAPGAGDFGPTALYAQLSLAYTPLNIAAALIFALGYLALTLRIARPALAIWRTNPDVTHTHVQSGASVSSSPTFAAVYAKATPRERPGLAWRWLRAVYHGLRADAPWRAELLLWLWVTTPVVLLLRHSAPPQVHYLLVLFPGVFLTSAFAAVDVPHWLGRLRPPQRTTPGTTPRWAALAVSAAITLLLIAQAGQSAVYVTSLADTSFTALAGYGYPLSELETADQAMTALQHANGAANVEIITPTAARYRDPLDYLLVSEHSTRVSLTANCLLLPAA